MKTIREETSAGGFTLLEVLVAMTILTIMGAALFTVFNQSTETWHRADARTQQFLAAREALGLMAMELRQAIVAPNASAGADVGAFWGLDGGEEVYFVAPTETRSEDADQDICVIGYWVNAAGELMRYCLSDNDSYDDWRSLYPHDIQGHSDPLGENIRSVTFEYWGPDDSKWDPTDDGRKKWESPDEDNTLPQAVRITLVVQDPMDPTNLKKDKKFTTVVRLNTAK